MMPITKTFQYGQHQVSIETGRIARQATGAVVVNMGETSVMVTVVGNTKAEEGRDFFPLTVHYIEKAYASGRIPGGFFKREGKPSEREVLTSRLIDRPIRPLFPEGFMNEVQVVATVLSWDPSVPADIVAMIGASAALSLSGIPFMGPLGAARVGYQEGQYLLNPSDEAMEHSALDLVVAGTSNAVLMVESEASELPEDVMLGAVVYGHEQMQTVIQAINEFVDEAGKPGWDWKPVALNSALMSEVSAFANAEIEQAYQLTEKQARYEALAVLREKVRTTFMKEGVDYTEKEVLACVSKLEKSHVRNSILSGNARIDGRDTRTVRPISIDCGLWPRIHGSALFTRGETQAIVAVTLGTGRDAQIIESASGEEKDRFMLHYNFPPYSVGETGMVGAPKRREIGHGRLARKALAAVIPSQEEFPYVIRSVSEITESNGSSSMATVCGTSLALMNAGVPVKKAVAGIAMGLIKEDNRFAVLTDILGDEDHLGDMDFKVAGTADGVTALQMDIKIEGITREIMAAALTQAKDGRMHILEKMNQVIQQPASMSDYAPRILTLQIPAEKIRDVIGSGGSTIRALTEETETTIDIEDDGTVKIAAVDGLKAEEALRRIRDLTTELEINQVYTGKVNGLREFGAFVSLPGNKSGLLHISEISGERIENIEDVMQSGQILNVRVLEIDRQGRIRLSMKEVQQPETTSLPSGVVTNA